MTHKGDRQSKRKKKKKKKIDNIEIVFIKWNVKSNAFRRDYSKAVYAEQKASSAWLAAYPFSKLQLAFLYE